MKKLIRLGMCALLVGLGVERMLVGGPLFAKSPPPKSESRAKPAAKTTGKKATAKQALDGARKAFAAMLKAARTDKALDPKTAKNKPFWLATKKLGGHLDRAGKGLVAKNDDFFKGISDARTAEVQMKIDWQLTDSKNEGVIDNAKKLGRALALLRTDFSKEAARKKKGGALTEKEKQQFAKMKAQQAALLKKISALEGKAKKDKALAAGLKKMSIYSNKVVGAPDTLDAYLATLYLLDEIEGMLYGYDYYVDAAWRGDWISVDTYTTEWETTYAEFATSETYEWSSVEESVEVPSSEAFEVSEEISEPEIDAQENWAASENIEMTDAEEEQIAAEEDNDNTADTSMEDASDSAGDDFDGDGDSDLSDNGPSDDAASDDAASDEPASDDGGSEEMSDDGGGDDGGSDDSGGDDGGSDDGGGGDDDGGGE